MTELSVDRLREMLGRETNRAALAERQVRDLSAEIVRLKFRIAELKSYATNQGKGKPSIPPRP